MNPFLSSAAATTATLAGALTLASVSVGLYALPHGRFPATLIQIARSRAVVYNPGVTGYYEQLLGGEEVRFFTAAEAKPTVVADRVYDRSFRLTRLLPGLQNVVSSTEPQGVTTNSFGLLGPQCSLAKPPDTRRIALLGDSIAQGWGAEQSKSFERVLENRLNASRTGERFEFLNFAMAGYELTQMLDQAEEEVPRFHPDVCFLALTELGAFRTWDEHLVRLIRLGVDPKYDFLRDAIRKSGAQPSDSAVALFAKLAPYRMEVLGEILGRMKQRAAQDGAQFLVALIPSLEDGGMSGKRLDEMPALLRSLDIPFVDASHTFANIFDLESLRINPFDVHPNVRAHAMIADQLYAELRSNRVIWQAFAGAGLVP